MDLVSSFIISIIFGIISCIPAIVIRKFFGTFYKIKSIFLMIVCSILGILLAYTIFYVIGIEIKELSIITMMIMCFGSYNILLTKDCIKSNQSNVVKVQLKEEVSDVSNIEQLIDNLMSDCGNVSLNSEYLNIYKDEVTSLYNMVVFTNELVFHIYALWLASLVSREAKDFQRIKNDVNGVLYKKIMLNDDNKLSQEEFNNIIDSRVNLILNEKDFEVKNFDFLSLCNAEIDILRESESKTSNDFYISDMRVLGYQSCNNPLAMMYLPSVYEAGFVDYYLVLFDKVMLGDNA